MELIPYKINDETRFEVKSVSSQTNGFYTVGIVEITDEFTLDAYLNSRGIEVK